MKHRVSFPRGHAPKPGCRSVVLALKGEGKERIEFAGDLPKDVAAKVLALVMEAAGIGAKPPKPAAAPLLPLQHCAAGSDGDCSHPGCPQLRDGEPAKSGRSCPMEHWQGRER